MNVRSKVAYGEELERQSRVSGLIAQGKKEQPRCPARTLWVLAFSLTACATTTKEKILRDMAIAGAVGVLIGQSHDVNKDAYSVMYAGTFAAITGAVELIYKDPDAVADGYKKENDKLKLQMDDLLKPKISFQAPGTLNSKIPAKYSHLVNPGEWKVFEIDEWIESSENRIIHQDRIMELIPPTLNPNNQTRSNQ